MLEVGNLLIYRSKKDTDAETYGGADEQLDKIIKSDHLKPDKDSQELMRCLVVGETDQLNLRKILKKLIHLVSRGTMNATAGSSMREGSDTGETDP